MARFNRKSVVPSAPGTGLSGVAAASKQANIKERKALYNSPFIWGNVQYLGTATMSPVERSQFLAGYGTCKVLEAGKVVRILH